MLALILQQVVYALAAQQISFACDVADYTAKSVPETVSVRRHSWLRSAGVSEDTKGCFEDLPFSGKVHYY